MNESPSTQKENIGKIDAFLFQLDDHIDFFEAESARHKNLHRKIRYSIYALTAVSTVLASIAAAYVKEAWIDILLVAITAFIGFLTSLEGIRKPLELWLHDRVIYHALEDIRREITYHKHGGLSDEALDNYFQKAQSLLREGSSTWKQHFEGKEDAGSEPKLDSGTIPHEPKEKPV